MRNNWGYDFNLETGQTVKDRIRCFLQSTAEHAEKKKVYAATGWKRINGQWEFLMQGDEQHTVFLEGRCGVYSFTRTTELDAVIKSLALFCICLCQRSANLVYDCSSFLLYFPFQLVGYTLPPP